MTTPRYQKIFLSDEDHLLMARRLKRFIKDLGLDSYPISLAKMELDRLCGFSSEERRLAWNAEHRKNSSAQSLSKFATQGKPHPILERLQIFEMVHLFYAFAPSDFPIEFRVRIHQLLMGALYSLVDQPVKRTCTNLRSCFDLSFVSREAHQTQPISFEGCSHFKRYLASLPGYNENQVAHEQVPSTREFHHTLVLMCESFFNLLEAVESHDFLVYRPQWTTPEQGLPSQGWLASDAFLEWKNQRQPTTDVWMSDLLYDICLSVNVNEKQTLIRLASELSSHYFSAVRFSEQQALAASPSASAILD